MPVVVVSSASVVGSTVTSASLVPRLRRKFLPAEPWQDTLSASQTSGATTIQLTNVTKWGQSEIIELPDGEQERIAPFSGTIVNPVTVERAHGGTTAAAHTSGDIVFKDPRFPYKTIIDAIEEVAAFETWPWLYVVGTITITPSASQYLYPITDSNFRNLIGQATQQTTGTITDVTRYGPLRVVYNLPASIAATGMALRITSFDNLTNALTVGYQAQITASTIPEGDVAECIMLGAAAKIMRSKGVQVASMDTSPKQQKATIAELVGQAENFRGEFRREKLRVQANLERTYGKPAEIWDIPNIRW